MRFQKHGLGELGKELLINPGIADHLHALFAGRDVIGIALSLALPYYTPMDLADASLVVAAESLTLRRVFTLDRDFYIYRLADGTALQVIR
jgi:hypothetical protein